jgi:hypothetical protein
MFIETLVKYLALFYFWLGGMPVLLAHSPPTPPLGEITLAQLAKPAQMFVER